MSAPPLGSLIYNRRHAPVGTAGTASKKTTLARIGAIDFDLNTDPGTLQTLATPAQIVSEVPTSSPAIRAVRPTATFAALQEWEGYVVSVDKHTFLASLVDLTGGEGRPTEEAEIPLEELSQNDIVKLKPGQIFRWAIGYQRSPSGTKMRVSQIVFRELPQWTRRELKEAKERAANLRNFFGD
jgi:hypothetical protein